MLKDFVCPFQCRKQIQDLQEHIDEESDKQSSKFGSFLNSFLADVLLFAAAFLIITVTLVVVYVVCSQSKLKPLVANVALQCIKETEAANPKLQDIYCVCKMQWCTIALLILILLGIALLVLAKIKKSNLFGGHLFSNATIVMLLISTTQLYIPVNLCEIAGSIHLFRIRGKLTPECIKFKKNWIWDVLEIDWKEVRVTLNGNEVNLPTSVILLFKHKFRAGEPVRKQPLLLHKVLKQGKTWFTLEKDNRDQNTTANDA